MQAFKENDTKEVRVRDVALPTLELLGSVRDEMYAGAYECFKLGDVFINLNCAPLANAIPAEAFRKSFFAIFEYFTRPGTFEFYMTVFKAIFGDDVAVEFIVPEEGHLQINIEALTVQLDFALARRIVSNAYVYDEIMTGAGDNLMFQGTTGLKTQSEIDALMAELVPAGVFSETTLTLS